MKTFDEWSLKLFFSVDLINSTAYKAKKAEERDDTEWCLFFEDFFKSFPQILDSSYAVLPQIFKFNNDLSQYKPDIWKILGDEILFYTELQDYQQTATHVVAFKRCIEEYNKLLAQKDIPIVRCKGTIWTAGFPLSNIQIEINGCIDFLGPSIDLGFRLAKLSTRRKLCISIETALLFSEAMIDIHQNNSVKIKEDYSLKFDGLKNLKGVYNNMLYPIFWLDVHNTAQNVQEDIWLGKKCNCDFADVIKYCKKYINNNPYIITPFIYNGSKKYNTIPDEIQQRKKDAISGRRQHIDSQYFAENIKNRGKSVSKDKSSNDKINIDLNYLLENLVKNSTYN